MPLPNLLIIGTQKAGTPWLAHLLGQHPDIFMYEEEIHYFDKSFNFSRGLDWYTSHFSDATIERLIGEKTPDYLWTNGHGVEGHLPNVHENIAGALPNAKLIAVLRNPVTRAVSAANHIIRSGRISPFLSVDSLLIGADRHLLERHGVIDYGRYFNHISAYYKHFERQNLLLLTYEEDIVADARAGLRKACDFLGVDRGFEFRDIGHRINSGAGSKIGLSVCHYLPLLRRPVKVIDRYLPPLKNRPSVETVHALHEIYAEENEKLFRLLGRRIEAWAPGTKTDLARASREPI